MEIQVLYNLDMVFLCEFWRKFGFIKCGYRKSELLVCDNLSYKIDIFGVV